MSEPPLRILAVDDTVVYRRILSQVVEDLPDMELAGTAPHGKIALAKMQQTHVDVVLLDIEMPEMDGLETLEAIRARYPETGVIMVSAANRKSATIVVECLERGAFDFVPKPEGASPDESRQMLVEPLRRLINSFRSRRHLRSALRQTTPKPSQTIAVPEAKEAVRQYAAIPQRIDIVAMGVSTGGPNALAEVIPRFPADLGVPVFIVQHMPALFTRPLAESLDRKSLLSVCEASDGDMIEPKKVFVAPGGRHMVVRRNPKNGPERFCIGLNDNPPENSCRPSVDVLFRSVAAHYNGNILAVIMTGMGADGREGVRAMKRQGCYCLTQSRESCVVYGMPQAVCDAGLSTETVPLDKMGQRIVSIVQTPVYSR